MAIDDAGLEVETGLTLTAPNNAAGLWITGNRSGGFFAPLAYIHNANTGASSPALRLVGAGSTPGGVLSVSTTGNGLLAEFGNAAQFVSHLDYLGNWTAVAFSTVSDRAAKMEFEPVNSVEILEQVTAIPIQTWAFQGDPSTRHIGPVAQDFRAAFGVGKDDRTIATVDADGVALAAIQGLNRKLEESMKAKDARIAELETRLRLLEGAVALAGRIDSNPMSPVSPCTARRPDWPPRLA